MNESGAKIEAMTQHDAANTYAMSDALASRFASLALAHVTREYPNKLDHVMVDGGDVAGPRQLHPIFFGSFDWHSCVHGYWLLARLLRRYPALEQAAQIRSLFDAQFTRENVEVERAYAAHPARRGFERPYGWAWLLMLAGELALDASPERQRWSDALRPLALVFAERFMEFLPKLTYPIRVGTHFNTAFALTLASEYARIEANDELAHLIVASVRRWYTNDIDCQAWEPGGDDFLSSALIEAECMRRILPRDEFMAWLGRFLPRLAASEPATLFTPAVVSDRSDGKIAHLDGLNLSRAWCWRSLANALDPADARRTLAEHAANQHLDASLPHIAGDYMGEHWLATFALLALDHTH